MDVQEQITHNPALKVWIEQISTQTVIIQVYAPTSNTEEDEVEQFYEDLQDLLELTPKKDVLFSLEGTGMQK